MEDPRKWVKITTSLRAKLDAGTLAPGDTVTIGYLSQEWDVARRTAAKALRTLEREGYLRCYAGCHGFVVIKPEQLAGADTGTAPMTEVNS